MDISMLFWVEAQKSILPTITADQSLTNYYMFIGEDNFDLSCAKVTLSRLRAEFIDLKYNEIPKKII